uniref:Proprotein convertase subtilisin/kexin type 5 n=1 Tax=Gopherus evgoodei TaxID=1825980 RepID=A0A8C4WD60_9SAUR
RLNEGALPTCPPKSAIGDPVWPPQTRSWSYFGVKPSQLCHFIGVGVLLGRFLLAETCVHTCPRGTFGDLKSRKCENCTDDCENCSGPRHCLKCQSQPHRPLYLHEVILCFFLYYIQFLLVLSVKENKLFFCLDRCFSFSLVCMDQFFLHNGKCLPDCPSGFYADSRSCSPCHEDCKECDGPDSDDCNECASRSFVLYNGECFEECPEGSYYETETEDCQECDRTCQICSSSSACLTCKEGMVLNSQGHCVTAKHCSLTEYHDEQTQTCKPCHKRCSRCTGPAEHQCLSCPKNGHLLSKYLAPAARFYFVFSFEDM